MLSNVHVSIACNVYDYLIRNNSFKLNKLYFIYGIIKPDYTPKLIEINHFVNDSIQFIDKEISLLSSLTYRNNKDFIKDYSIRLGVVIHYLNDYFCHAHNDEIMKKNMFKHFQYEMLQIPSSFKLSKLRYKNALILLEPSKITNFINNEISNYKSTNFSYSNDLNYATNISCLVSSSLVSILFHNSKNNVA